MKKVIALTLVILLSLGTFIPVAAAQTTLATVVAALGLTNLKDAEAIFEGYLTDAQIDKLNTYLETNMRSLKNNMVADANATGFTKTKLKALVNVVRDFDMASITTPEAASTKIAQQKQTAIDNLGTELLTILATARGVRTNAEYADELVDEILTSPSNQIVVRNLSTGQITVNLASFKTKAKTKALLQAMFPNTFGNYDGTIDQLQTLANYILNTNDTDYKMTTELKNKVIAIATSYGFYSTTGGSTGGGGGGTTPPPQPPAPPAPPPVVPTTPTQPVQTIVPPTAITTTTNPAGQTVARVDNQALRTAVETVVKAITDAGKTTATQAAAVMIQVQTTNVNMIVGVPVDAMKSLNENNVGLVIESNGMGYSIPAGAIDNSALAQFGDNVTLQISSKTVDAATAFEGIEVDPAVKEKAKVIELSLEVVNAQGETQGKISSFKKPIEISISLDDVNGDPDKLGVYYINPNTRKPEFVGGKVVDGRLVISLSHYSRYAIMEANITYTDIANHWAKKYIESMAAKHIILGYGDGTFLPEKNVTRAEFAAMLVKALELDVIAYSGTYTDVKAGDWYANVVATAAAKGIIGGYPEGTFKPNQAVTRIEMATMLSNAMKDTPLSPDSISMLTSKYKDAAIIADWGKAAVAKATQEGLMTGMEGGFNPTGKATRAQAATVIYKLFNK